MGHIGLGRQPYAFAMDANSLEAGSVQVFVICQRNIMLQQGQAAYHMRLFEHGLDP